MTVWLGDIPCGPEHPVVLVAEIGVNHSGSLDDAVNMIHLAKMSGASMIKFQKRTPRLCVPKSEWYKQRETPWGTMDYIDYKERIEFGAVEYDTINHVCKEEGIPWFASVWDEESLAFLENYDLPCYKIGSASLTDWPLVSAIVDTGRPIILSTGMSTEEEIFRAVMHISRSWYRLILCHSTSIYPCPRNQLNLRMIQTLQVQYPKLTIGYSGHEISGRVTPAAVALGASYVERHFTLDRRGWGTDQAASLEHGQFKDMADRIHETWQALGDGVKIIYPEEEEKKASLRRVPDGGHKEESEENAQARIGSG
jgi:N-acetylneuraminate synthase